MTREPIRDACDHRWTPEHCELGIDRPSRPPEIVRIPTASSSEIEALVYPADGDGPHPAVTLADDGGTTARRHNSTAERFADEGFTAIAFAQKRIGPDGYRRVVNWATSQPDIDGTRIFAWCRCLDDLHALPVTAPDPQLRGAIVHPPFSNNRGAVRALRGALRRRAATSYPVLVVIDGKTSDSGLLRRMAQHSHGIEVFVAKPNAPERDCEHLDDRLLGVEVDFLRFHAGLPATMRQAR